MTDNTETEWESEIVRIQSGERWEFGTLDKILDSLQREMIKTEVPDGTLLMKKRYAT
jgi:hypothetical protein